MIKRIVIAGCRYYDNYGEAKQFIDKCISDLRTNNTIIIISGASSGADAIGERYAAENGFEIEKYPADWKRFGRKAGPIRNRQLAELCDIAICFWNENSKGTKSMIDCARKLGKEVIIKKI